MLLYNKKELRYTKEELIIMPDIHDNKTFITFPVKRISLDTYQCPCGRNGLHRYKTYATGLDDADSDWGSYDEDYLFESDDPCFHKYKVIHLDYLKNEFILQIKE